MPKITVYLKSALMPVAVLLLSVNQPVLADQDWILHEATPVRMRIMRTVSSADAHEGDKADFQTLDDVSVGNVVVIPKNSTALATITVAESKKRMARDKLGMNIDYVRLPSGEKLARRGIQDLKGGGHSGAMTGGMVATAIVFWPAAPFFLFMHGKDVSVPEGHEVTVYTNSDYKVDQANIQSASIAVSQNGVSVRPSGPALTNADVLKLKGSGLGDELIVQKIKMSPGNYRLEVDELGQLKKAGLSDAVIGAMMSAQGR